MPKCFLICPIGEEGTETRRISDIVLNYIVSPVCKEYGYEVIRSDTEFTVNSINDDIFSHLDNDELAIADLTGHNPNVFYEAGYRKAKGLPLIHIARTGTPLPFDTNAIRTYFYDTEIDKAYRAKEDLKKVIENIKNGSAQKLPSDAVSIELSNLYRAPLETGWGYIVKINIYNSSPSSIFIKDIAIKKSSTTFSFIKEKIKLLSTVTKRNNVVIDERKLMSQSIPFKVAPNDFASGYFGLSNINKDIALNEGDTVSVMARINDSTVEKEIKIGIIENCIDLNF